MWAVDIKKICIFLTVVLLPNMALSVTCPSGYSEFSVDDNHIVVPMSQACPDGYSQLYKVDDCADADAGSVCAMCDSGYALGNAANCVELCSADQKTIRFGKNLSFNLLKKPNTKPALNILTPKNKHCYVDLNTGNASGLNFELPSGATYHAVQNDGGYRVCAPGYTLSYDCGIGGGVPPESQSLLSGYWYTVPANAGSCRVPDGMRFSGWYMDGKKQAPYTVYSYNFNTNKTLTAMFGDNTKYKVNYFCAAEDMGAIYTDEVVVGESVAPKTNMCPYDPKKTEPLAWVVPFSQEEINTMVALGFDLSDVADFGFLEVYFGVGDSLIKSEIEEFLLLLILDLHLSCVYEPEEHADNPESCALAKMFFEHTYFPNFDALIGSSDVSEETQVLLQMLYKEISSETDVGLYPMYIPTLYNMTWNCGDYFSVYGGYDFDGQTRYGWTVNYRCDYGSYGVDDVSFVGWEVDGVLYEGNKLTYNWTEDKTATGIFDYNLNANFDCGTDGVLTSGETTLTYSSRGAGDVYVPLNINTQCEPKKGKKFVGWKMDNEETVYDVGDTLDWLKTFFENCDDYYNYCDTDLNFTAVYEDVILADVNYYCAVGDANPVYVDKVVYGGIDVKTNMCPYDIKTTEPLAWVVPFSSDETNQVIALGESGLNLSMMESFLKPYFGQAGGVLDNEMSELMFSILLQYYAQCDNKTDATCTLSRLIYEHTYLDPNAWASDPFDEMYSWFRDIYSDTDLNLLPLYHATRYDINWDCGRFFYDETQDLASTDYRYGWDVVPKSCKQGIAGQTSESIAECEDDNCYGGISFYGWAINDENYEFAYNASANFTYKWTEDVNATAMFDYDLTAKFDCGTDNVLASGESEVKYSELANGADTIWLDVNTVCQSGSQAKTFVGWRLKNNDTEYQVGDRLDWLSTLLSADNCYYPSNCNRLVFEAVYEFVDGIKYYCAYDAPAEQYDHLQKFYGDPIAVLEPQCASPYAGATQMFWYTPFTDDEIAQLNAIIPYDSLSAESQKFVAPFMRYTDVIDTNAFLFVMGMSGVTLIQESSEYNSLYIDLLKKHVYGTEDNSNVSDNISLYALYLYMPLEPKYNAGNIPVHGRGTDAMFDFLVWPYYGQKYSLQEFSPSTCNSDIDIVGYEYDGNVYGVNDTITWLYTENIEFNMLFDWNITSQFDCGADGVLQNESMATKVYNATNAQGNVKLNLNIDAVCVPNSTSKKFVGWKYANSVYSVGRTIDLWGALSNRNPNRDLLDDRTHCPLGVDNGMFKFTAVYEDVVDVNYYCSASDVLPTYTNQYPANSTSAPLRQSGCSYDTKKYELFGWYTPFTAEEAAKLKSYSFNTKYPEYWAVIEPIFISQTSDYALDRNALFILAGMWSRGSGFSSDAGVNYLAELLQKHWFIKGYSSTINLSGSTNLYAFYTGKSYSLNFDCGVGEYEFWDDLNTGYYGAVQKLCDSCSVGNYTNTGMGFVGWEIDGNVYELCEPFVWEWTQNKTAIAIYDYDMTANFDCGADGVLLSGDAVVKNNARGNSTDAIPLNITAQCKPNPGKKFVGWSNNGKTYNIGQTLNWLNYAGESVVNFTAVYEDVVDVNYYCSAADAVPTYTEQYPVGTTAVAMRKSGCDYDTGTYQHMNWFTPFTDEEVAKLKSYSFHTNHTDFWAVIEPTFVSQTNSYVEDYDIVFMMAGLYAGRGLDTNDDGVKYLAELLQKHWYFISETSEIPVTGNTDLYAFYVNYL